MRNSVVQPDPIRLRYRNELRELVKTIVQAGDLPTPGRIRSLSPVSEITKAERSQFEEVALTLLLNLNEGQAARYGLRPSEFADWSLKVRQR